MIVIIQKDTQEPALRQLAVRLMNQGVRIGRTPGRDSDVLTLVGDTWRLDPEGLAALPYVLDVRRITPPYRLAGRAAHPDNTVVEVGDARIGAEFCLIAGPCAVESQVQMAGVARRVKAAGAQLLRGGVFKPRTSPYSFQGLGQAGISMLTEAGHEAGLRWCRRSRTPASWRTWIRWIFCRSGPGICRISPCSRPWVRSGSPCC